MCIWKMENGKYYVPTIEEFHVGLELESKCGEKWVKDVVECVNEYTTQDMLNQNLYRMKYLDREDIESLEWKCIEDFKSDNDGTTHLTFERPYKRYPQERLRLNYIVETGKLWIFVVMDIHHYHNTFKGYIKNKSELKTLMKQLDI